MQEKDLKYFVENLPEHPGIQSRGKFLNSAVVVPFIKTGDEFSLLFQKRAQGIRQGAEISFPGGMFDPARDRCFQDTALREAEEETGLDRSQIQVLGRLHTLVAPMGVTVEAFPVLLNIKSIDELTNATSEVETHFTVPVSFFTNNPPEKYHVRLEIQPSYTDKNGNKVTLLPSEELGLPVRYHSPWGGKKFRVYIYKTDEHTIWGITAEIVKEVIDRLTPGKK